MVKKFEKNKVEGSKMDTPLTKGTGQKLGVPAKGPISEGISKKTKKPVLSDEQQKQLNDGLIEAAKMGNLKLVAKLLESGAEANASNEWSEATALLYAVYEKQTEIAKLLIGKGANVNGFSAEESILHAAVESNNKEIVELLVKSGACVTTKNKINETPIDCAETEEIASILLDGLCNPNMKQIGYWYEGA